MASNFAFYPQSTTSLFTVGSATVTFNMTLNNAAGTGTLALSGGDYAVSGARIANTGTSNVQILFTTPGTSGVTLTSDNGMPMLSQTIETFRVQGFSVCKMLCLDGSTTVWITCGEGL